ncbi:MAG: three-Cys-motif partner protein TcmP [Nitrospinae bacterium]|nr:three-Cys-motif partner protein TcmP [Nitrospinota bacterium]
MVSELLKDVNNLAPSFFFIDPYEHPFSLKLMNKIMKLDKTEIMVNFMYYQIIRDIENPMKEQRCLKLFDPDDPHNIDLKTGGKFDEDKMLGYLHQRIGAKYYIPFNVYFGPDEKVGSGKLKYLLIHYSNNYKAFDLMLNIMWKYSEDNKPLMVGNRRPILFPIKDIADLKTKILSKYGAGDKMTFVRLVEENWRLYFRETHFRSVLKELEKDKMIQVKIVTSKTQRGLSGEDIIVFKGKQQLL